MMTRVCAGHHAAVIISFESLVRINTKTLAWHKVKELTCSLHLLCGVSSMTLGEFSESSYSDVGPQEE